jgi:DNA-binding transcriptional regulator/RsmH inhibitor MraZ
MSNFENIRTTIYQKLQGMTWSGQPFAFVYPYHKLGVEGYPAATFEQSGITSEIATSKDNYRVYSFEIVIQQELATTTRDEGVQIRDNATIQLIDSIDSDWTLWGMCDIVEIWRSEPWEVEAEDGIICYSRTEIRCKVLTDIS